MSNSDITMSRERAVAHCRSFADAARSLIATIETHFVHEGVVLINTQQLRAALAVWDNEQPPLPLEEGLES